MIPTFRPHYKKDAIHSHPLDIPESWGLNDKRQVSHNQINIALNKKKYFSKAFPVGEATLHSEASELIAGPLLPLYISGKMIEKEKGWKRNIGWATLAGSVLSYSTFIAGLLSKSKTLILGGLHNIFLGFASIPVLGIIVGVGSYATMQMGIFLKNIFYNLPCLKGTDAWEKTKTYFKAFAAFTLGLVVGTAIGFGVACAFGLAAGLLAITPAGWAIIGVFAAACAFKLANVVINRFIKKVNKNNSKKLKINSNEEYEDDEASISKKEPENFAEWEKRQLEIENKNKNDNVSGSNSPQSIQGISMNENNTQTDGTASPSPISPSEQNHSSNNDGDSYVKKTIADLSAGGSFNDVSQSSNNSTTNSLINNPFAKFQDSQNAGTIVTDHNPFNALTQ